MSRFDLTPAEHRRKLLIDILSDSTPLEVNGDFLIDNVFCDFDIDEWCRATDITYVINRNPHPEFRCKTTVIFSCALL